MSPSDIAARAKAAQAQAEYFKNATAQANSPVAGPVTNPKPIVPEWLNQLPAIGATPAPQPPVGGLFPQPAVSAPPQLGGLMDFNALAHQLAGGQSMPSMGVNPTMNSLFANFMAKRGNFLFPSQPRNPRPTIGVRG